MDLGDEEDELMLILLLVGYTLASKISRASRMLLREAILPTTASPWQHMYDSRSERAFIIYLGINVRMFDRLLSPFEEIYKSTTMRNLQPGQYLRMLQRPSRRTLPAHVGLAMALRWCCSQADQHTLCLMFGVVPSTFSYYLPYVLSILLMCLQKDSAANIEFPDFSLQMVYAKMVKH